MVPVVRATRLTVPAPPSVITPPRSRLSAVRLIAVPEILPLVVSSPVSAMVTPDPPATVPLTVSATPSLSVKAAAVNEPRVVTALVVPVAPRRLAAAEAEPVRVPAIKVPPSVIDPLVAIRETVPAPPSVTSPLMAMLVPCRLIEAPATVCPALIASRSALVSVTPPATEMVLEMVSAGTSFSENAADGNRPRVPTWLEPRSVTVPMAEPLNTPVMIRPDPLSLTVPTLATSVVELTALPPVLIVPEMVMFGAVSDTGAADSTLAIVRLSVVSNVKPVATVNEPRVVTSLALPRPTEPPLATPDSVVTCRSVLAPSSMLRVDRRSNARAAPPLPTPRSRLLASVKPCAVIDPCAEPSRTRLDPTPVRSTIWPRRPTLSTPGVSSAYSKMPPVIVPAPATEKAFARTDTVPVEGAEASAPVVKRPTPSSPLERRMTSPEVAETIPLTLSARPSFSEIVPVVAVKEPRLVIWFAATEAPLRIADAPTEPISVSAPIVPVSVMPPVAAVAIRSTVPVEVTRPEIARLVPLNVTPEPLTVCPAATVSKPPLVSVTAPAVAETLLATVSAAPSFRLMTVPVSVPSVPIWLEPERLMAVIAEPDSVPVVMDPVPAIVVVWATSDTELVALPPVVIEPGMVMLFAFSDTGPPAVSSPATVRSVPSPSVNPPALTVNVPTLVTVLLRLLNVTEPVLATPVSVVTFSSSNPPSEMLFVDCRSSAVALPRPTLRLRLAPSVIPVAVIEPRAAPSRTKGVPTPVRSAIWAPTPPTCNAVRESVAYSNVPPVMVPAGSTVIESARAETVPVETAANVPPAWTAMEFPLPAAFSTMSPAVAVTTPVTFRTVPLLTAIDPVVAVNNPRSTI